MPDIETTAKNKGGRPRKFPGENRTAHTFRLREMNRARLIDNAAKNGRSVSEEIENSIEQYFIYEKFLGNLAEEGSAAALLRAFQRVMFKVLMMSKTVSVSDRGTPIEFEIRTRKEIQAAIAVISHVFAATEERRPVDHERLGLEKQPWGTGDRGRRIAYSYLSWEFDPSEALDVAKTTWIDASWTGDGKRLGRLRLAEDDAENAKEVEWRRYQGAPEKRSLEDIFAERDGGRARNASAPPRPSDSDQDEGDELPLDAPAAKPKRARKTTPKA